MRCGQETINAKFCSKSCAAKYNNLGVRRNGNTPTLCPICHHPTKRPSSLCCSQSCHQTHLYRQYIERWMAGEELGYNSLGLVSNYVHRYLVETRGEQCEECGWNNRHPISGKVPVQDHHIDGDWQNCREDNLKLLCPNCHALTPNFAGRNKGNGRPQRYKT